MQIKTLSLGAIETNCYLISTDKAAIVIDPGFKNNEVEEFLLKNSSKERAILLTHAHFDHIGAAPYLRTSTETKIAIGEEENSALSNKTFNLSDMFGAQLPEFSADILLNDNQIFYVGDIEIKVIKTSGHTLGGVCYLVDNILFSGDTLFFESIGRTDFPNGDFSALSASIKKLYTLPNDTVVLSGHGPKTTISHEKQFNPFVR